MNLNWIFVVLAMVLGLSAAGYGDRMGNGTKYDLGISLSGGYGTISAHMVSRFGRGFTHRQGDLHPNQYIDIAKVEGGENYKSYMLRNETQTVVTPTFCPFSDQVCQYWPIKTLQTVNPLAPMLKALIAAAECTLETKINSVAVTAYDIEPQHQSLTKQHVVLALDAMGVASHDFLDHSAAIACKALGLRGGVCHPAGYTPPGHPILSVEFTRESLSTALWTGECNTIRQWGRTHSSKLGHDAMQRSTDSSTSNHRFEKNMKSVFNHICGRFGQRSQDKLDVVLSQQTGLGAVLDYEHVGGRAVVENVGAVLLMGEHAGDEKMQGWLREVLTKQFANGDSVDFLKAEDIAPDPTFVGSRAAAWDEGKIQRNSL